ncbi:MAG: tetratricopeptide repeat protein [Leptospirillum sp.]
MGFRKHFRRESFPESKPNHDSLENKARLAFDGGHFSQAAKVYRELLKQEKNPVWVENLADSYDALARELAGKGLVREALDQWRKRSNDCGKPLGEGPYLQWLLRSGNIERDADFLFGLLGGDTLPDEDRAKLERGLAALALSRQETELVALPCESALFRHRPHALRAISEYRQGRFPEMEEHLRSIPFRSPYQDLRSILKSLALIEAGKKDLARETLSRVGTDSPFEKLASPVRAFFLPDQEWLSALSALDEEGRRMAMDIKGCPTEFRPLILDLAKMGKSASPRSLFDLSIRYRKIIPSGPGDIILRKLMPHVSRRLWSAVPESTFFPPGEKDRLSALGEENKNDLQSAESFWLRSGSALKDSSDAQERKKAALILRRMLTRLDPGSVSEFDLPNILLLLEESLRLDPEDKETVLQLARGYRRLSDIKKVRKLLDEALKQFPDDADILFEAAETALATHACAKALVYGQRLQRLDPISPRIRELLVRVHLSSARKKISAGRPSAALQEIEQARPLLRTKEERTTASVLNALVVFKKAGLPSLAETMLAGAVTEMGSTYSVGVYILLESGRTGLPVTPLLELVGINPSVVPEAGEVVSMARTINSFGDWDPARCSISFFSKPLKKAAAHRYSEGDMLEICEALFICREDRLLLTYSDAALKALPNHPSFLYFRVEARSRTSENGISSQDARCLRMAAVESEKKADLRTAHRIRELLETEEDPDDFEEDISEVLELLRDLLQKGKQEVVLDYFRDRFGDVLLDEMQGRFSGNSKQFARSLIAMLTNAQSEF